MYCQNCGTQNNEEAKCCSNCGKQLKPNNVQDEQTYNQNSMPCRPKTWLVESILVTVFCCLPFGIVGIINAAKVENAINQGNTQQAAKSSHTAGLWTKIGFFVGLAVVVIYIICIFA